MRKTYINKIRIILCMLRRYNLSQFTIVDFVVLDFKSFRTNDYVLFSPLCPFCHALLSIIHHGRQFSIQFIKSTILVNWTVIRVCYNLICTFAFFMQYIIICWSALGQIILFSLLSLKMILQLDYIWPEKAALNRKLTWILPACNQLFFLLLLFLSDFICELMKELSTSLLLFENQINIIVHRHHPL